MLINFFIPLKEDGAITWESFNPESVIAGLQKRDLAMLGLIFQCSRNLLVKFYYKIKQPTPPPLVFVKLVEIIQNKNKADFLVF